MYYRRFSAELFRCFAQNGWFGVAGSDTLVGMAGVYRVEIVDVGSGEVLDSSEAAGSLAAARRVCELMAAAPRVPLTGRVCRGRLFLEGGKLYGREFVCDGGVWVDRGETAGV